MELMANEISIMAEDFDDMIDDGAVLDSTRDLNRFGL